MTKFILLLTIFLTGCCRLNNFPTPYSTLSMNQITTQSILLESNTLTEKKSNHQRLLFLINLKLLEF